MSIASRNKEWFVLHLLPERLQVRLILGIGTLLIAGSGHATPTAYSQLADNTPVADSTSAIDQVEERLQELGHAVANRPKEASRETAPVDAPTPIAGKTNTLPVSTESSDARLARFSNSKTSDTLGGSFDASDPGAMFSGLMSESTVTALTATALVVGLFLLCASLVKRGLPRSSQLLPKEVVTILGRTSFGSKQFGHLVKVGNKLVLLNVTPSHVETLVEIDDPDTVTRLLGLCTQVSDSSSSKEFDSIFRQFAKEPAQGFLGGEAGLAGGRRA